MMAVSGSSTQHLPIRDTAARECGFTPVEAAQVLAPYYARADTFFGYKLGVHLAVTLVLAAVSGLWVASAGVAAAAAAVFYCTRAVRPASFASRAAFGVAAQIFVALHLYQTDGLAEMHFFYFTALAFMTVGLDSRSMLPGAALAVLGHAAFDLSDGADPTQLIAHASIAAVHAAICGFCARTLRRHVLHAAVQLERLEAAEARATAKETRLRQVTDAMPGAAYRCLMTPDFLYSYPYVSHGVLDLLRLNPAEVRSGRDPISERTVPEDVPALRASLRAAFARGPGARWWHEFRVAVDGVGVRWIRAEAVAAAADGGCLLWTGLLVDVTDEKRMEDERRKLAAVLLEGQRLESLGVMAEGLAHEFNNLLTVVQGHLMLAAETNPDAVAALEPAAVAARTAADLCRQLQTYTGRGADAPEPVDLNTMVAESAELLRVGVPTDARFQLRLGGDVPAVRGDATALRQLLLNLVSNAGEAVAGRAGTVAVRTGGAAGGAWLEVSDDGVGMAADVAERMFDPFFSTKFVGRGMGLAAVHGIAAGHGAKVAVDSAPGRGTTVRVTFPDAEAPVRQRRTPLTGELSGTVRINVRALAAAAP